MKSVVGTSLPADDLAAFFRIWGVALSFAGGTPFTYDPTDDQNEIDELKGQYQPGGSSSGPALVVIGRRHHKGGHINGALLDPEHRGVCAVFAEADKFKAGDADARFEIFVHEIGHLLNLIHDYADTPYATAMDTYDRRDGANRADAWHRCISASGTTGAAMQAFFRDGARRPAGLPLSPRCHLHLQSPRADVLPWLSPFDDDLSEGEDRDAKLACELVLHHEKLQVGQPLGLTIVVSLDGQTEPVAVPKGLGLSERTIELRIQGPQGRRRYAATTVFCAEGTRLLTSRSRIKRHYSLLADVHGPLFPIPGAYRLQACIPGYGARSAVQEIEVAPAQGELASPVLQAFLKAGMPRSDAAGWHALKHVVHDSRVERATRAHFASEIVARRPSLLNGESAVITAAKFESPRIYQDHLLLQLRRMARAQDKPFAAAVGLIDNAESALRQDDPDHPSLEYLKELREPEKWRGTQ